MFEHGNQKEAARLKEIEENLQIEQSLLKMYTNRLVTYSDDERAAALAIQGIKDKLAEKFREFCEADERILMAERAIVKYTNERDGITGKITGHTKKIKKLQKMKEQMARMEEELKEMQKK